MRTTTHLFTATITAGLLLAPLSLAWGQVGGGNRQIGSPTRDSDVGRNIRAPSTSTRRMEAGTTQQRTGNATTGGNLNSNAGPRRTLIGNSASAAGDRPRNTTRNPAAKDPLERNPAILDAVTGIPATGPIRRQAAFGTTGRSLIDGGGIDDATFVEQINPPAGGIDRATLATDNVTANPSTANLQRGDDLHDFSGSSTGDTVTGSATDRIGTADSGSPTTNTFPNANSAVMGSSANASGRTSANRSLRSNPALYSNRRQLAQRLGLGFDASTPDMRLANVLGGTWAERVGFQSGDRIVGIGGQSVYGYRDLANFLSTHPTGRATVDVERNGQIEQLPLNLGSLTRWLQGSDQTGRPQAGDPTVAVTASGRRIAGTAAEAVRAARQRAEQQLLQNSTEQ